MPSASPRHRKPEPYRNGKSSPWEPGDEAVGEYSRERLVAMDATFC
jgi:hypothetical protein